MADVALPRGNVDYTFIQAVIWGFASVALVSLLSLAGGVIIPLISGKYRHRWMHFFIAMAVGTLSSDAVLHLLPEILGVHSSDDTTAPAVLPNDSAPSVSSTLLPLGHDDDHGHQESHEPPGSQPPPMPSVVATHFEVLSEHLQEKHERRRRHSAPHAENSAAHSGEDENASSLTPERRVLLKLLLALVAVYALYLLEFIAYYRGLEPIDPNTQHKGQVGSSCESMARVAWDEERGLAASGASGADLVVTTSPLSSGPPVMCGLRGPALIILFGDGVHNFVDGVAIGASFVISLGVGLATTIAVLCHELPHELGDMAVLLESGLSMPLALSLNLLSALTAFVGLGVGLYAVAIDSAVDWLLAGTAGMFLYVAWIDMLAHLKHEAAERRDPWYVTCLLQNAGFAFGTSLMFAIAWYEDELFQ